MDKSKLRKLRSLAFFYKSEVEQSKIDVVGTICANQPDETLEQRDEIQAFHDRYNKNNKLELLDIETDPLLQEDIYYSYREERLEKIATNEHDDETIWRK